GANRIVSKSLSHAVDGLGHAVPRSAPQLVHRQLGAVVGRQIGHAHAEEPHALGDVHGVEELAGDTGDRDACTQRRRDRARPGDGPKVAKADLYRDRPPDALGLAASDASLAISLHVATPTDAHSPSSSRMRTRRLDAIVTPSPNRRVPPVTSRNASSRAIPSTSGVKEVNTSCRRPLYS